MKMFGKYELGRRLGKGGFSEVYLARFTGINDFEKVLVVKIMLPNIAESPEFVDLFISEAKITAMLSHANLVQVFDFGKVRDRYFMAMEYIKGLTLSEILARHEQQGDRMPAEIALYIAQEMAQGLTYAHTAIDGQGRVLKAVHRDINPRNVFLQWDGSVKIADFGMVGILKVAESFKGKAVGTMGFMSPEQAMGEETDAATDIYATGLVLYNLLTGRMPFDLTDEEKCMIAQARADFPPSRKVAPKLPKVAHEIVERATRRRAADRYGSADEMAEAISSALYEMGRITEKTAAQYMKQFKDALRAPPPPPEEEGVSAEVAAALAEPSAEGEAPAGIPAEAALAGPEAGSPQPPSARRAGAAAGPKFQFLVRGQKQPLGPLTIDEVATCLQTGELTGFEKASTDGVRWMKWQYFSELNAFLLDPTQRKAARPMAGVLIVSASADHRARYATALIQKGFRAYEADTVEKAYDTCLLYRPEALLSDVVTAGTGGFELLKVLRADPQTALIPVVLVSAIEGRGVWSKGFRHGAADIVPASLDPDAVAARIQSIIDGLPFRSTGESGKLTQGVAAELIKSIGRIRLSGVLHVTSAAMDGQVVFDQGEVIEARVGSLLHDEAIGAISKFEAGEYSFEEFSGASGLVGAASRSDSRTCEAGAFCEARPLIWAEDEPGRPFMWRPGDGLPDFFVQPVAFDDRLPDTVANLKPCAVAIKSLDVRGSEMKKTFKTDRRLSEIPLILVSPILSAGADEGGERGLGISPAAQKVFANTMRKTLSPTWTLRKMIGKGIEAYHGTLREIGPATLLETLSEQAFTGAVAIEGPFGTAAVTLDRGAPVSASAAGAFRAQGREAFISLMHWRAGRFSLSSRAPSGTPNLAGGMTGMLDEAFAEVNSKIAGAHIRLKAGMPLKLSRQIDDADLETLSSNVKLVVALADEQMQPSELVSMSGLAENETTEILTSLLAMGVLI